MNVFEQWESEVRGYCRLYPTVFASASNARQVDESGRSFVDFFAGAGVLNFGHNNPRMKKALIEFIESDGVAHSLDMYTVPKRAFMQKFIDTILTPRGMKYRMQFTGPTGTNAVEAALKLARRVTGRSTVVACAHGFHGMTLGSLACTANSYFRDAAGVPLEHVVRMPFGADSDPEGAMEGLNAMRKLFEDPSGGLPKPAAILVEPLQAEGGVFVAGKEWLQGLRTLADELGALLIFDDIQAACGRTGGYFSFDGMGVEPDIICLAKGIGGFGTPLAMNLVKPEHDKHWSPGEHTGTFRGQGLSFVAGKEALTYFDDDELMNEVRRKGKLMREHLLALAEEFPDRDMQVRGKGMMQAIDLADGALAKMVSARCFDNGLLIGACGSGGKVLKLIPPLTIPDEDLAEGLQLLSQSVRQAARQAEEVAA